MTKTPRKTTDKKLLRNEAKRLAVEEGLSFAEIADRLGVSPRTIYRWEEEDGDWDTRRIVIATAVREVRENGSKIVPLLEIDRAIERLASAMDYVEAKSLEGCAKALKDLLEYRSKLNPTTAKELAEVAIDSGISPQQFLEELQRQWAERKAA